VRRRLVIAIASVAGVAVLLFALPLAVVLQRSYRNEELLRLQRDTDAATRGIDVSHGATDRIELPSFTGELGVYSRTGQRIAGNGPRVADALTRRALGARAPVASAAAGLLLVAVPLVAGERVTGAVRARRDQEAVAQRAHRAWLALAGLGAGVVALAVLAALTLGRRLSRPLDTLASAARRVGEGDFAARAAPSGITEIDEVAAALNASSGRVGELIARERTFSADASHQLRTPLAALRLELEAAALESPESEPGMSAAMTQVDRLEGTIETLLAVTRGAPSGERRTDLTDTIRQLELTWHGPLAADGRPLRITIDAEPAVAAISSTVLDQILQILMHNAHAHGTGTVTVAVRPAADAIALEITDEGPGFGPDPEEAFQRGNGTGHGIGLPLARSLAHAEGARLQINRPGPNPTVTLLLPTPDRLPPVDGTWPT
jgi:signal transduction histidine kinase